MVTHKASQVGSLLRQGARDLPGNAARVWERARALGREARSRAATMIAQRRGSHGRELDPDSMTKDELMDLARKEEVSGRSSMTKAQLAAALRRTRKS